MLGLPFAAGIACLLLPRRAGRLAGLLAVIGSAVTLLAGIQLYALNRTAASLAQNRNDVTVPAGFRVDDLNVFIALGAAFFGLLIAVYSLSYMRRKTRLCEYYSYVLITLSFSLGAILADHLILLLVFWGMLGITLYLMIGLAGADAAAAAKKTLIIVGGSDCFLMLGLLMVWSLTDRTTLSGPALELSSGPLWGAFFCFLATALAKAGAMPVHTWVPDCGERAPLPVVAYLPASLDKLLGIYLLMRIVRELFAMNYWTYSILLLIGAGTIIFAVMMALVQHDLKRLLSYHAVSQVGYMVLGIGTGSLIGIAGGLFHMLNNALYKSCLFLCAGGVQEKRKTTDLDKLGGLARVMPITFGTFLVAALAISGIPPLNGFTSKWMIYQGLIESGLDNGVLWTLCLAAAMLGSALILASFVKVLHAVFLRNPASSGLERERITEVGALMWIPMVLLAGLCVLFGVFPFAVPLAAFIFPAVGEVTISGTWMPGLATVMLLIAFSVGGGCSIT